MERERGAEGAGRRRYEPGEVLLCVECGTLSDPDAWGWRAYRMNDREHPELPVLAFYCSTCAEREFDGP